MIVAYNPNTRHRTTGDRGGHEKRVPKLSQLHALCTLLVTFDAVHHFMMHAPIAKLRAAYEHFADGSHHQITVDSAPKKLKATWTMKSLVTAISAEKFGMWMKGKSKGTISISTGPR
jgi:hypothetical protein